MFGLTVGYDIGHAASRPQTYIPIAAWGDSLTAGAGASDNAHRYPAVASALFSPPRDILNRGIGAQTSTQIAARQGGVPILVTVAGDVIPEARSFSWNFNDGLQGWYPRPVGVAATLGLEGGALRIDGNTGATQTGAQVWLGGATIAAGVTCRLELDVLENAMAGVTQVGLTGATADGGTGGLQGQSGYYSTGYKSMTWQNTASSRALLIYFGNRETARAAVVDNVRLDTWTPVSVTAKSVNVLYNSGVYTGSLAGRLAGVHGVMSTDGSGNWTFTRDEAGYAVACPAGTAFVPDEALSLRERTAWIWAGRNNAGAREVVKADIAAMVGHLGHNRYFVGSVLNGAGEGTGTSAYSGITALNADLLAIYGRRYVDIRRALVAAGNPAADAADIAADRVPASLRYDAIHLNDAGQAIVAQTMVAATMALGW